MSNQNTQEDAGRRSATSTTTTTTTATITAVTGKLRSQILSGRQWMVRRRDVVSVFVGESDPSLNGAAVESINGFAIFAIGELVRLRRDQDRDCDCSRLLLY